MSTMGRILYKVSGLSSGLCATTQARDDPTDGVAGG